MEALPCHRPYEKPVPQGANPPIPKIPKSLSLASIIFIFIIIIIIIIIIFFFFSEV